MASQQSPDLSALSLQEESSGDTVMSPPKRPGLASSSLGLTEGSSEDIFTESDLPDGLPSQAATLHLRLEEVRNPTSKFVVASLTPSTHKARREYRNRDLGACKRICDALLRQPNCRKPVPTSSTRAEMLIVMKPSSSG